MTSLFEELDECRQAEDAWAAALGKIVARWKADSGTIHLMGPDGALHLRTSVNIPEVVLDKVRVVPVGKGMAGLAAERKRAVDVCNIQTDTSGDVRPGAKATGMGGAIALPMFAGEDVVGVLGVANRDVRTFTDEEIDELIEAGRRLASWQVAAVSTVS